MQRFNYNEIAVKVDGVEILCSEASASVSNSLSPSILVNRQSPEEYLADSPLGGSIELSYYSSGVGALDKYLITGSGPFPVNIGGIAISSGYLSRYSLSVSPHKHVFAQAAIDFHEDFTGRIIPTRSVASSKNLLNYNEIEIIESGLNLSGNILSIKYDFSQEMDPLTILSGKGVSEVRFLTKESSLSLVSYQDNQSFPAEGKNVYIRVASKALEEETDNLVFNSDFEDTGTGILGFSTFGSASISTSEKFYGTRSVSLSSLDSYILTYSSVPLVSGKEYSLSVYVKTNAASASISLFANNTTLFRTAYNSWSRVSATFTSDGANQIIKIINNTSSIVYVDSIQIEEKSRPTTFAKNSRNRTILEINGVATSKTATHSFGNLSTSEYKIIQTGFGKKPVFGRFAGGLYGAATINSIKAGEYLFIYGLNLESTSSVFFRQNAEVKDIIIHSDRVISVKVPKYATTGRVMIINAAGSSESFLAGIEKIITITSTAF